MVVLLTLFIALITRLVSWYLFDTGIKQRILQAIKKLQTLRKANDFPKTHQGEIDVLEDELENICQNITQPESETA